MVNYVLFYHYTSERGLRGIKASGQINESSTDANHTHFGEGTYGTSMPPSRGQDVIAENNWRCHGVHYIRNGKVSWALEVKIPRNKVQKIKCKRDILRHFGPVYLHKYDWREIEVPRYPTPTPPSSRSPSPSPPPVRRVRPAYMPSYNYESSPPAPLRTSVPRQNSGRPVGRDTGKDSSAEGDGWAVAAGVVGAVGAAAMALYRLFS